MKIDIDEIFLPITNIIKRIGATERYWEIPDLAPYEPPESYVDSGDLDKYKIKTKKGGNILADSNGNQFVIYIPYGKDYRFHVSDCSTINQMKTEGRYSRYACKTDTSDLFETSSGKIHLDVCQNCLFALDYGNFRHSREYERKSIVRNFRIVEFFQHYKSLISDIPTRTDKSLLNDDVYSDNWQQISTMAKNAVNWTCQECLINLSDHRNLLHAHHANGNKQDNRNSNIEVLCILCHSKRPKHQHIVVSDQDRNLIIQRQAVIRAIRGE